MSNDPIRIILVDDHQLARESLSLLLGFDERFSIIKECGDGNDAIEQARALGPDVMLVDVNMEPVNGFEVVRNIMESHPAIRIIGISVNNHPLYATRMLSLGARGFVTKGSSLDEMTEAILEVHAGRRYISGDLRDHIL